MPVTTPYLDGLLGSQNVIVRIPRLGNDDDYRQLDQTAPPAPPHPHSTNDAGHGEPEVDMGRPNTTIAKPRWAT
jgi:hypothetical protein